MKQRVFCPLADRRLDWGGRHLDRQQQFQLETKQVYSYVRVDAKSEWLFTCRDE